MTPRNASLKHTYIHGHRSRVPNIQYLGFFVLVSLSSLISSHKKTIYITHTHFVNQWTVITKSTIA